MNQGTGKAKAAHIKICHDLWTTNVVLCKHMGLEDTEDKMCDRCGTAKETVIRTLTDFKEEGLVAIKGNELVIEDVSKLENLRY